MRCPEVTRRGCDGLEVDAMSCVRWIERDGVGGARIGCEENQDCVVECEARMMGLKITNNLQKRNNKKKKCENINHRQYMVANAVFGFT